MDGCLEYKNFVRFEIPIYKRRHCSDLNAFDQHLLPETSGRLAGPSGRHLAFGEHISEHFFEVVISLWGGLIFLSAMDGIPHEKNPHPGFLPLDEVHCDPQGIVGAFIAIRAIVYDNQEFLFRHATSKRGKSLAYYTG